MGGKVTLACRNAERGQQAVEKLKKEALEKPVSEVRAVAQGPARKFLSQRRNSNPYILQSVAVVEDFGSLG